MGQLNIETVSVTTTVSTEVTQAQVVGNTVLLNVKLGMLVAFATGVVSGEVTLEVEVGALVLVSNVVVMVVDEGKDCNPVRLSSGPVKVSVVELALTMETVTEVVKVTLAAGLSVMSELVDSVPVLSSAVLVTLVGVVVT